jgi:HPt (histidine-containing phosphotransfer) domain-containing protein
MSDVLDEAQLMDRVDGDVEFLQETVTMLDEDGPELLEQIQAAVSAQDAAALVKPAHTLKGMVANFCAPRAEAAARELERMGREEHLTGVDAAVERARLETARLQEALREMLRTKTT